MALRAALILPLLVVLMASILVQSTGLSGASSGVIQFQGQGQGKGAPLTVVTCTSPSVACFPSGVLPPSSSITCKSPISGLFFSSPCDLWDNCNNVPQGAYCAYFLFIFPTSTDLDNGVTLTTNNAGAIQVDSSNNQASASFGGFGAFNGAALIAAVGVVIGIAGLAGITVFGSGENAESVHIIFIGMMLLGLLAVLTGIEGYLTGASTSAFVQINAIVPGLGDVFFIVLAFLYVIGITGTVSRGGM
jgi:hypothetical protein